MRIATDSQPWAAAHNYRLAQPCCQEDLPSAEAMRTRVRDDQHKEGCGWRGAKGKVPDDF